MTIAEQHINENAQKFHVVLDNEFKLSMWKIAYLNGMFKNVLK